jgi:hypothetical protein
LINFGFTSAVSTTSPNGANPAFVKGAIESDIIAQLPFVADPSGIIDDLVRHHQPCRTDAGPADARAQDV